MVRAIVPERVRLRKLMKDSKADRSNRAVEMAMKVVDICATFHTAQRRVLGLVIIAAIYVM